MRNSNEDKFSSLSLMESQFITGYKNTVSLETKIIKEPWENHPIL